MILLGKAIEDEPLTDAEIKHRIQRAKLQHDSGQWNSKLLQVGQLTYLILFL
jgi:hypothetical protein